MGTIASYTTPDGYTIRVFDSMYLDYGIAIIRPDGTEGYYSPHALSSESYGSSEDEETGEVTPWTEAEWVDALRSEAWELMDAFLPSED
jgi:hypothetical protein